MSPKHRNGPAAPTPQINPFTSSYRGSGEVGEVGVLFFKEVEAGGRSGNGARNANLCVVGCA